MENLITIFVNGSFLIPGDPNNERKDVVIYEVGTPIQIDENEWEAWVSNESDNYENYLCPEMFQHPDWDGTFSFFRNVSFVKEEDHLRRLKAELSQTWLY